jgi:hypothetical protein
MDAYCMLRLFERYDEGKMPRGPESCRSPSFLVNNNVIIYSGWGHSKNYVQFITRYHELCFGAPPAVTVVEKKRSDVRRYLNYVVLDKPFDVFST